MAGIEEKPMSKGAALFAGLLQAVALYLVYLSLSLTDIWGYMPAIVQLAAYGLLALAMIMLTQRGLMMKSIWTLKVSLKAAMLSVVLLSIAAILAGSQGARLLEIAVKPRAVFDYPVPEIIMMVTPPDHMDAAEFTERLSIEDEPSSGLKPIPEGSIIRIRVKNAVYAPILIAGHNRLAFLSGVDGGFVAQFTLKDEIVWQVRQGSRVIGQWPILIQADDAPVIERADFRQMLTGDGLFALSLKLSDDFGLHEVAVGVMAENSDTDILHDRTLLTISGLREFSGETYINLASSEFAGRKVDLIVEVTDQAGQKQRKTLAGISLPSREFSNPYSRRIIEIRTAVKTEPENLKKLARELMALGLVPGDGQTPTIYYMALRSAYWRLTMAKSQDEINSAQDILWDLANQLEMGDSGQFSRDILDLLASLKLTLHQRLDVAGIKKQLQEIDKVIILFLRSQKVMLNPNADPAKYDVKELRRIYSKILKHSHYKRFDQAIDLISYLEHGFIYGERDILSEQGFKRFQLVNRARDKVNILKKTQRQVMSFALRNTVNMELASLDGATTASPKLLANGDILKWITIQQKLGVSVNDLGRSLVKSGMNTAQLTVAAGDLIDDVVQSMEAGDMEAAVQYQSEVLTLLGRLRNILDRELQFRPQSP